LVFYEQSLLKPIKKTKQ